MSAIWGIVPVSSTEKTEEALHTMRTSYAPFAIDRYSSLSLDTGVSFHCGLQFFTEESFQEVLPFYDNTKGVLFTADVVLDNREELLSQFPLLSGDTTDSGLLLAALENGDLLCVIIFWARLPLLSIIQVPTHFIYILIIWETAACSMPFCRTVFCLALRWFLWPTLYQQPSPKNGLLHVSPPLRQI